MKAITGIVSCASKAANANAIRSTYFEKLPNPFFFRGGSGQLPRRDGDTLMLRCQDSIEHLPRKMWWLYEYLLRTAEFDFFLKLDDDGYVHTHALNSFLERLKRERRSLTHYMGSRILNPAVPRSNVWHVGKTPTPTFTEKPRGISKHIYCDGSSGYILSRRAMEVIVERGRGHFLSESEIYEDKCHGDVLVPNGFLPTRMPAGIVVDNLSPEQLIEHHAKRENPARRIFNFEKGSQDRPEAEPIERDVKPRQPMLVLKPNRAILVVYHLGNLPGWEPLFAEQMQTLRESGLLDVAARVVVNCELPTKTVRAAARWLLRYRNVVFRQDTDAMPSEGEIGTLRFVWDEASALLEDAYILYYHSKGVSRPGNLAVRDWRRVMEYFCVERWRDAVSTLERGADMAGVNWEEIPYPHFSGNFWWTRSEYINGLQPLQRHSLIGSVEQFPSFMHSPRHDAELWPGSGQPRVAQLYRTGLESGQHYHLPYFREQYAEPDPIGKLPLAFHYYHLFLPEGAESRGLAIFEEHLHDLHASGLQAGLARMTIVVVSRWENARREVQRRAPHAQVWQVASGHEMATHIRLQADLATMPDEALIFYAHSKAVTYSEQDPRGPDELRKATDWRRTMARICITRWPEAIRPILDDDFDLSGAFYLTPERWKPHCAAMGIDFGDCAFFGGNFWWARAGFLKKLPKVDLSADRHFAERWIGLTPHQAASAFYNVWPDEEAYQMVLGIV